jgi:hypothetical protein
MTFVIYWRVLINFCMASLINVPEMFNGISRRIILKTIFSSDYRLVLFHFFPEYFFCLDFRF